MSKTPSGSPGFQKPCPHCATPYHIRRTACPTCGKKREEPIAKVAAHATREAVKIVITGWSVAESAPTAKIIALPVKEVVYVAMRGFSCRLFDTIVAVKEGQQIHDQRAITELLLQKQPIRPVADAEGMMTCPHCAETFRPSPEQLALANATSAPRKPTRVA